MDKCPNVKEVPGICDGLPVFCRGCTESVNRCTQLMSESRDEARAEVRGLRQQVKEMQEHPLIEIRPDGKVRGHNCAGCEGLERELSTALLQLRAMVEERDLYSEVVDAAETWLFHHGHGGVAEAEANKALRRQVEQLGEKANPEKRNVPPPKKGEFPDKAVNGCKCPCHREIAEDGTGWPCGEDECRPCHVEPGRFR